MKKRIITILTMLFMAVVPCMSQIVILEDDENFNRQVRDVNDFHVMVPSQDVPHDQYIPIGDGLLLLTGMAGYYLLRRQRRGEDDVE